MRDPATAAALALLFTACADQGRARNPDPQRWHNVKTEVREKFPEVRHLDTARVQELLRKAGVQVVDVRRPDEFAVSHLQGAVNIPLADGFESGAKRLDPKRPVLLYCSVGYRSAMAAQRLRTEGFADVSNYLGSIFEWHNQGLPVYDDHGRTGRVHPYDESWGELLRR